MQGIILFIIPALKMAVMLIKSFEQATDFNDKLIKEHNLSLAIDSVAK
jgi:hypothetical protein